MLRIERSALSRAAKREQVSAFSAVLGSVL
jgi:hypothetical protein